MGLFKKSKKNKKKKDYQIPMFFWYDWQKHDIEFLKQINSDTEKRLIEELKNFELSTLRANRIMSTCLLLLFLFSGYATSNYYGQGEKDIILINAAFYAAITCFISLLFLLWVTKNHTLFFSGTMPKNIFYTDVYEGIAKEQYHKKYLLNQITDIQERIEHDKKINAIRFLITNISISILLVGMPLSLIMAHIKCVLIPF
jgi:hypothetical protein